MRARARQFQPGSHFLQFGTTVPDLDEVCTFVCKFQSISKSIPNYLVTLRLNLALEILNGIQSWFPNYLSFFHTDCSRWFAHSYKQGSGCKYFDRRYFLLIHMHHYKNLSLKRMVQTFMILTRIKMNMKMKTMMTPKKAVMMRNIMTKQPV